MAIIELKSISKAFGKNQALKNVSFRVNDKEFFCIVGPTNAGKTTTLRTIAGLEKQDEGDVLFNGENVNNLYPRERNVAMLFQNLALYPNKNGFENLATPLKIKKFPEEQIKKRVMEVAEILHITHLLERLPKTYSGGERQRVALARTIIRRPSVYLFDEPLSNLDALLRVEMRSELKRLQRDLGQTMIYVTHDQVEAISMSDRIAVLNKGKIQQIGKPSLIFSKPENMFTAGFFGSPPMNFLKCDVEKKGSKIFLVCGKLIVEVTELGEKLEGMSSVILGVRPQDVGIDLNNKNEQFYKIVAVEPLGAKKVLTFEIGKYLLLSLVSARVLLKSGDNVCIKINRKKIYIFDEVSQKIIV